MILSLLSLPLLLTATPFRVVQDSARVVRYEFTVAASPAQVWAAWTTNDGLRSFFGPSAIIELETFGRLAIHFDPASDAGKRGAEGNRVLAFEPERMLTTTWDAPPTFPAVRAQRTFLEIRFAPEGTTRTRVVITNSGFGEGAEWAAAHQYFLGAWTWVAAALQYRFEAGPIDWSNPPDLLPRMKVIGGETAVRWAAQAR